MESLYWLRCPEASAALIVHVTGITNLARVGAFQRRLPEGVGLAVVPPPQPSESGNISSMATWVTAQADELLAVVPQPRLAMVGFCMAGHASLHLAAELRRRGVAVQQLLCLDTTLLSDYPLVPIMDLLALPGPEHAYGRLADQLKALQLEYIAGECPIQLWGQRMIAIMREHLPELDSSILKQDQANPGDLASTRALYMQWAEFIWRVMTAPEADRSPCTAEVISQSSSMLDGLPPSAIAVVRRLPVEHDVLLAAVAEDPWFWSVLAELTPADLPGA